MKMLGEVCRIDKIMSVVKEVVTNHRMLRNTYNITKEKRLEGVVTLNFIVTDKEALDIKRLIETLSQCDVAIASNNCFEDNVENKP